MLLFVLPRELFAMAVFVIVVGREVIKTITTKLDHLIIVGKPAV